MDPSTLSNYNDIYSTHLHLNLDFDFNAQIISGTVTHTLKVENEKCEKVIFDTRELTIEEVYLTSSNTPLPFTLGESSPAYGAPLIVDLSSLTLKSNDEFQITIKYQTSKNSLGIKWLNAQQTEGKKHPYLFTQFQAIHCRSAIPCQDTPAKKITFTAKLTVPSPLIALMSALSTSQSSNTFEFSQKITVPTYLIAFAVGDLVSSDISPRCKVWTEREKLDQAAFEFAETEDYLRTAEEITIPYEWGRYDLLCLPGSFPYGGMENPCLTFVTPTLLAGDRSLTAVVAHEIAHSWTGNLVTNASWNDFWLNEGFTVFLERKIIGRMFGKQRQHFEYLLGNFSLLDSIQQFGYHHPHTCLVHDLKGIDPDDAFSSVPYEKGSQFLFFLENKVGGEEVFEPVLKEWIEINRLKSTSSDAFKAFFQSKFPAVDIDWATWYYTPGLPPFDISTLLDQTLATNAIHLSDLWVSESFQPSNVSSKDIEGWSSDQIVYLLDNIRNKTSNNGGLPSSKIALMDELYKFTSSRNSEIRCSWLSLCLISKYEAIFPEVVDFVSIQGRMKFIRPMYRLLAACSDRGRQLALDTFEKLKDSYHNIAKKLVEESLYPRPQ